MYLLKDGFHSYLAKIKAHFLCTLRKIIKKHKYYLMVKRLTPANTCISDHTNTIELNQTGRYTDEMLGYKTKDILALVRMGDKCFIHLNGESIVGLSMGHIGRCYIRGPGIYIDISDEDVYIYWITVDSNIRKSGISTKLYNYYSEYYSSIGKKNLVYLVDCNNKIMLDIVNKFGFEEIEKIITYKIFNYLIINLRKSKSIDFNCYFTTKYRDVHTI
jgi:ribosomal protein S18 acetylase RimI-like enzyme